MPINSKKVYLNKNKMFEQKKNGKLPMSDKPFDKNEKTNIYLTFQMIEYLININ